MYPNVVIAGQKSHADRGGAQYEERQGQLGRPPPASLHGHGQRRPDRAHDESERKNDERPEGALQPRFEREENLRKHQHTGNTEDKKVKVLRGASDHDADGDLARCDLGVTIMPICLEQLAGVMRGG